jgi:hypothetical protein
MLVYGEPGAGKTVLAGSAAAVEEMSPVLLIDIEGGTFSIRERYPEVDVVRVQNWDDMQRVYDELYRGSQYNTVILDSLTEIQKFSMYNIMKELIRREADRDPDVPGMREWLKNTEQMRLLVRAFRDLPIHTIFTALMKVDKDQKTGSVSILPSLSGKLAHEVGGFVDILTYLYTKQIQDTNTRLLLTTNTERAVSKDRSDRLPAVIENPDMQTLYDYIFNVRVDEEDEE